MVEERIYVHISKQLEYVTKDHTVTHTLIYIILTKRCYSLLVFSGIIALNY